MGGGGGGRYRITNHDVFILTHNESWLQLYGLITNNFLVAYNELNHGPIFEAITDYDGNVLYPITDHDKLLPPCAFWSKVP